MGIYYPLTVLNIFKTSFKGYSNFVVFKALNEILYINHSAQTGAKANTGYLLFPESIHLFNTCMESFLYARSGGTSKNLMENSSEPAVQ